MIDSWQKLLEGEREEVRFFLQEEFGEDTEMTFDFAGYFLRVHRQDKELAAHELICRECRIAREQQELQAAWDELQNVPTKDYREQQAAAFVKEQ